MIFDAGWVLYGEWLRRERRRTDAREQLRTAHDMLDAMGIEAFAGRAWRELAATGETARKRTVQASGELTAPEAQVARLARDGLPDPEIGTRLFISARTVQYHLGKVFTKLGISSRSQLDRVLLADPAAARPADHRQRPALTRANCADQPVEHATFAAPTPKLAAASSYADLWPSARHRCYTPAGWLPRLATGGREHGRSRPRVDIGK